MPDEIKTGSAPPTRVPAHIADAPKVDAPVAEKAEPAKAKLPPTEKERKAAHLDMVAKEDDKARFDRRASELKTQLDIHFENINQAHEKYPYRRIAFEDMTEAEQRNWNERRNDIDMANKAYHRAVKATCAAHSDEDIHLAKLRADAAKSAH